MTREWAEKKVIREKEILEEKLKADRILTNIEYNDFFKNMGIKKKEGTLTEDDWKEIARHVYYVIKDNGWSKEEVIESSPDLFDFLAQ